MKINSTFKKILCLKCDFHTLINLSLINEEWNKICMSDEILRSKVEIDMPVYLKKPETINWIKWYMVINYYSYQLIDVNGNMTFPVGYGVIKFTSNLSGVYIYYIDVFNRAFYSYQNSIELYTENVVDVIMREDDYYFLKSDGTIETNSFFEIDFPEKITRLMMNDYSNYMAFITITKKLYIRHLEREENLYVDDNVTEIGFFDDLYYKKGSDLYQAKVVTKISNSAPRDEIVKFGIIAQNVHMFAKSHSYLYLLFNNGKTWVMYGSVYDDRQNIKSISYDRQGIITLVYNNDLISKTGTFNSLYTSGYSQATEVELALNENFIDLYPISSGHYLALVKVDPIGNLQKLGLL